MSFTKYSSAGAYHWAKLAGRGPREYHARLHARYGWFVEQAERRRPSRIVDVGCGDAALTHLLAVATGAETIGVEAEPSGVEEARRALAAVGSAVVVVQGAAEELPFGDDFADVVVLCEVIEHVEDPATVIHQAARVLNAEGALLVSTPQRDDGPLPPFHLREYEPRELADECRKSFAEVDVTVAEPAWIVRAQARRPLRIATSFVARYGANVFAFQRAPSPRTRRWRQLYAVAQRPRPIAK